VGKIRKTIVAGFRPRQFGAWASAATFAAEPDRDTPLYRVVAGYRDVHNASVQVMVPMTPLEARRHAVWLVAAADEADMLNEGFTEPREPRIDRRYDVAGDGEATVVIVDHKGAA
jgi:hypothetical protein